MVIHNPRILEFLELHLNIFLEIGTPIKFNYQ